jgi:threonine/homoserine/homoserine lactone efflux protein
MPAVSVPVPHLLVPFLLVVAVLTVTPGPDMALVLRYGARGGSRLAWYTGLGCCTGIAVHATAAVAGLSALLATSAVAFTVIKLVGAVYLAWLGLTALWHSRKGTAATGEADDAGVEVMPARGAATLTRRGCYYQGLLTNLLNPKIALLFLTLLPQFVAGDEPRTATSAVLAAVFLIIAVAWWRLFSLLVGGLARLLARPAVGTALERATGVVLIGLGLRVALERA